MDNDGKTKIDEKDFIKSLDALEMLATGQLTAGADEDLEKAAGAGEADEDLEKAAGAGEGTDDDDDGGGTDDDDDGGGTDDDDDDDGEDTEKSFADIAGEGSENIEKAVEVSDFLADLVDQVGYAIDNLVKSVQGQVDSLKAKIDGMEKSLSDASAFNIELAKSLKTSFGALDTGMEDLRKSINEVGDSPAHGRKSIVTALQKSFVMDEDGNAKAPNKVDVLNAMESALEKSVDGITSLDVVRYEATGELKPNVKTILGL